MKGPSQDCRLCGVAGPAGPLTEPASPRLEPVLSAQDALEDRLGARTKGAAGIVLNSQETERRALEWRYGLCGGANKFCCKHKLRKTSFGSLCDV